MAIKKIKWQIAQYLEFIWWKRYLKNRPVESYLTWKKNYWQNFVQKLAPHIVLNSSQSILDAGCGPAGIFMIIPGKVVAVDPLLDEYIKLPHFKQELYPHTTFITSKLENFNSDLSFDYIFCLNAINHTENLEESLDRLKTCLAKNGSLVLSTDVHRWKLLKWLFRFVPGDALHPQQHSALDYIEILKNCGLNVLDNFTFDKGFIFNYQIFILNK